MKENEEINQISLKRLIEKWNTDAEKIKLLTSDKESKHQREVANHFLIQLYKCIGDAEIELKKLKLINKKQKVA